MHIEDPHVKNIIAKIKQFFSCLERMIPCYFEIKGIATLIMENYLIPSSIKNIC